MSCDIVPDARWLAKQKGLDPAKVVCRDCEEAEGCPFNVGPATGAETAANPEEIFKNVLLTTQGGPARVEMFYERLEKHTEIVRRKVK